MNDDALAEGGQVGRIFMQSHHELFVVIDPELQFGDVGTVTLVEQDDKRIFFKAVLNGF